MKRSRYIKIAAAVILVLTALFWLFKGVMDLFGGVSGGIMNVILAIVLFGLVILCWKLTLVGGIGISFLAVILAVYFNLTLPDIYTAYIPLFLICLPMVLSGLLFIEADWSAKKRN